jgi:phage shock protein PspC (stress-responsive transcriptional regulator)
MVAGVCAGLPGFWGLGTNGLRLLFILAALCGGIGVVVYLACWLVIPSENQRADDDVVRSVVVLAWAAGGLVALILLAAGAAAATVFDLGWLVFTLAAAVLVVALSGRTRIPMLAAVLSVAALALPAMAVALTSVRIPLHSAAVRRPADAVQLTDTDFRSGFGTMLIDLRQTKLPTSGSLTMQIHAGLRRTVVALPATACVHVRVNYDVKSFTSQLATLLSGHQTAPFHDIVLFGRVYGATPDTTSRGTAVNRDGGSGLTLTVDFSSLGGSLYVRDYPDNVDPDTTPNWPGFPVTPELRPPTSYLRSLSKKLAAKTLSAWRVRRDADLVSELRIDALMPSPCVR